jgi:deoxycytidylate deaminase
MQKVVLNLRQGAELREVEEISRNQLDEIRSLLTDRSSAAKLVHESDLREITEYGRAIHGEMDAIMNCVRLGISVKGTHLFVTTFPCHNCTRHIIGAGIKKVYYIEPYPKSKAQDLHNDAICFDETEAARTGKIPFLPFVGIGPRRYLDLFSLDLSSGREIKRKADDGMPLLPAKTESAPRVPMLALNYLEREDKLLDEFKDVLQQLQGMKHGENRIKKPQLAEPDAGT